MTPPGQAKLLETVTTERQMAWEKSRQVVVALPTAKAIHHLSVHQGALAQWSFWGSPLDLCSSYLLPFHVHKVWQWSRSFSSTPPSAATAKANASGLSGNRYPNLLESFKASPTSLLPPERSWDSPDGLLFQHCFITWSKFLYQPVGLRSNFPPESTSVSVPGKQQQNWLSPENTEFWVRV